MEQNNLKKSTKIASILSVVLVIALIISILLSAGNKQRLKKSEITFELGTITEITLNPEEFFYIGENDNTEDISFDVSKVDVNKVGSYEVCATRGNKEFTITVHIVDTTDPKVEFKTRYIFTNDIKNLTDYSSMIENIEEASDYTTKVIRFEKTDNLYELGEDELKKLTSTISVNDANDKVDVLGTMEIPTDEGIYKSILAVEDNEGNVTYREIYVILDKTAARITEVEDLVVTVGKKSKLTEKPELTLSKYSAYDSVDGYIKGDALTIELKERNADKHEWLTIVSYTDRAGNESSGEFLITVKLASGGSSNSTTSSGSENRGSSSGSSTPSYPTYNPVDLNHDGFVSADEENEYITPEKQACLDAGLGVVVPFNGGEYYMTVTDLSRYVNGVHGMDILHNYLISKGMDGHASSHSSDANYVWYIIEDIHPVSTLTPDDPAFWH